MELNSKISFPIINLVKSLRNGAAHNNCILADLAHGTSRPPVEISQAIAKIASINTSQRRKKLSCRPMLEFVALLYTYNLMPVVLYNNDETNPKGAIILSDSAANYTRFTIYYKNTNGFYSSVDVYNPNGKTITLLNFAYGDLDNTDPMILKFRIITISNTKIDTAQNSTGTYVTGEQRLSADRHYTKGDFVAITQVLGYRG